ncbi:MAG: 2-hydroxychromene-2-carboxylate isomerase [Nevskiales bacterium]
MSPEKVNRQVIRFYFDYISHNAYLAWTQIHTLAARYDQEVEPVPVLFAGLLKHYSQRGPAEIAPKRDWMIRNVLRKTVDLDIPFAPPASHPFNPLLALRVSCLPLPQDTRLRLIDALFRAVWVERRAVQQVEVVQDVLAELGLDAAAMLGLAQTVEIKQQLLRQTEQALAEGIFGVPTMRIDEELFWGFDDLPYLERWLQGDDPLVNADLAAWETVRPSAQRKLTE